MERGQLIEALKALEMEKGIDPKTILDGMREALEAAYRRDYKDDEIRVDIDPETGEMRVLALRQTVQGEEEIVEEHEVTPDDFGRVAAQTAKQVILQKIRDAEREKLFHEYAGKEGDIVTGIVQQADRRFTILDLGGAEALLPPSEQMPRERYKHNSRIKAYIIEVRKTTREPQIIVSRRHPGLVKRLFELEVPEIQRGIVEIRAIAREAGHRTKMAVHSNDTNVDPVGACVGPKGSRVRMVVQELRDEKIDIIQWDADPARLVANALSPARVARVIIEDGEKTARVIVPDDQLSLAIGREGQNARLAAKLTGFKVDIKSESDAMTEAQQAFAELITAKDKPQAPEGKEVPTEPEVMPEPGRCEAVTKSGTRCKKNAVPGSAFCRVHGGAET